jgi:hypothetical protein
MGTTAYCQCICSNLTSGVVAVYQMYQKRHFNVILCLRHVRILCAGRTPAVGKSVATMISVCPAKAAAFEGHVPPMKITQHSSEALNRNKLITILARNTTIVQAQDRSVQHVQTESKKKQTKIYELPHRY